jgi:hypothetical protein
MPTRTPTSKRPPSGRFARPGGKPAQRQARGQRPASSRRPTMPTRRKPAKSGRAKAVEKLGSLLPGRRSQKRGGSGGRSKKGTAGGLALLAGAAGLVMKNRDKITSKLRHKDSSDETAHPVQSQPVPSNSGPTDTPGKVDPSGATDHPTA